MSRRGSIQCQVCRHDQRGVIERDLVTGMTHGRVAAKHGVSVFSVRRHLKRHVSQERRAALLAGPVALGKLVAEAAEAGIGLLDYVRATRITLARQLQKADEANERSVMPMLARALTETVRIEGQLTGELLKHTAPLVVQHTANFYASPDWVRLRDELLALGRTHGHKVLVSVIAMLERLDGRNCEPQPLNGTPLPAIEHKPDPPEASA